MKLIQNNRGAILVVALIVIALITVMGTMITMTSSIELNLARNQKSAKSAFYQAEDGRVIAGNILRAAAWGTPYSDGDNFSDNSDIRVTDGDFFMEGIADSDTAAASPDITFTGDIVASIDIDKVSVDPLPGGSAEFGAGYEGIGKETTMQATYTIDSIGTGVGASQARVIAQYRVIPP